MRGVEPTEICAGDTVAWSRCESEYPPSAGWILTYYFGSGSVAPKVVAATGIGSTHTVSISATDSATWPAGLYHWQARVTNTGTGEAYTIDSGTLMVAPNPSATYDRRTHAEICYAAITSALESSAGDFIVEYEIDGVKVKRNREAALQERARYRSIMRLQSGKSLFTQIPVRFNP